MFKVQWTCQNITNLLKVCLIMQQVVLEIHIFFGWSVPVRAEREMGLFPTLHQWGSGPTAVELFSSLSLLSEDPGAHSVHSESEIILEFESQHHQCASRQTSFESCQIKVYIVKFWDATVLSKLQHPTVSQYHQGHMAVSTDRYSRQKSGIEENGNICHPPNVYPACFTLCSLCLEIRQQMPQVAREIHVKKYVKLQMLQQVLYLTCGSILVSPFQETRRRKGDRLEIKYTPCWCCAGLSTPAMGWHPPPIKGMHIWWWSPQTTTKCADIAYKTF